MKHLYLLLILSTFCCQSISAQEIVSTEFLSSLSAAGVESEYNVESDYGLTFYKVNYTTLNIQNEPDTASGLVIVPTSTGESFPLLCYQHGTVDGREDVPSRLAGGVSLAVGFAAQGYAVTAADYLGLGDNAGNHPYLHAETEASAAIDLMLALKSDLDAFNLSLTDELYITGYSQGGHAAAAAQKVIERDYVGQLDITASGPMSGPYSISDVMVDFTLGDADYFFVAYLASTTISMKLAYPDLLADYELEGIFKSPYVAAMRRFESEEIGLFSLNTTLVGLLSGLTGSVKPRAMLHDSILVALTTDPDHPLSVALADNDLLDWVPQAPTLLVGCGSDDQVSFENTTVACDQLVSNGAVELSCENVQSSANESHIQCVSPAAERVAEYFDSFRFPTSTDEQSFGEESNLWSPNPTAGLLQLSESNYIGNSYQLISHTGAILHKGLIQNSTIDISDLSDGVYILLYGDEQSRKYQKILLTK